MAQWIIIRLIGFITQDKRSIVLIIFVATWFMSQWASNKNKHFTTLLEVQQLAHLQAKAVAEWINEQILASQSLSDEINNEVINLIPTKSESFYLFSVVEQAIALVALVVAIATFVSVNPILRLFWSATAAKIFVNQ